MRVNEMPDARHQSIVAEGPQMRFKIAEALPLAPTGSPNQCPLFAFSLEDAMANAQTKPKAVEAAVKQTAQAVARQSRTVAESAETLKESSVQLEDSADRRTELAADRTLLAAERTYGAWMRTGLIAMATGLGAKAGLAGVVPEWMIVANGTVLVLFSVFCFIAAVWRHLNPFAPPPRGDTKRIPPLILISVSGFLVLVSIAALIGIWFGRTGGS